MMVQRLKELQETGAREKGNLDRLQELCSDLEQDREAFKGSLDRAEKLHNNLQSRCSSSLGCLALPHIMQRLRTCMQLRADTRSVSAFPIAGILLGLGWQGVILWLYKDRASQ